MELILQNHLKIRKVPEAVRRDVCNRLTIVNPEWMENERHGRKNWKVPRYLSFYETSREGELIVPRGFIRQAITIAKGHNEAFMIDDRRRTLPNVEFTFTGMLKPYQQAAVADILRKDFGILNAPTGSGKTVIALAVIAARKQPTLIVVHTRELLTQWRDRIQAFLGIPADEIGIIGAGHWGLCKINIGLAQTLYRCAGDFSQFIGQIVVDECHRTPSRIFSEIVTAFSSKYMLGLTATPWRRDKLSRLIFWHLGDVAHSIESAGLIESGDILRPKIVTRQTAFQPIHDPATQYSKMLSELVADPERNRLIVRDVAREAKKAQGISLVLSDRKRHCEALRDAMATEYDIEAEVLTGDTPQKERRNIVDRLNQGNLPVLIATGQLIGEGFDCNKLSTLFLATPIKFSGRVLQYLGRVLRPAPGKDQAKVFDYVDPVGVLQAAARARQKVYVRH